MDIYIPAIKYRDWVPGRKFLGYQVAWKAEGNKHRYKFWEKSRQIGATWATASDVAEVTGVRGAKNDTWITSRDEIQAGLFVEDVKKFAAILGIGAKDRGELMVEKASARQILFASGRSAYSMSSNIDAQAGKRGNRVIDEAALHKDLRRLFAIAEPGITWGGQLAMFSTHRGSQNFFVRLRDEIVSGKRKGWYHQKTTLADALDYGFLAKLKEKLPQDDPIQDMDEADYFNFKMAAAADQETFAEEYMCVPSDDGATFLPFDLIDPCLYPAAEPWERTISQLNNSQGEYYLGVDVGRDHDFTVIWVLERDGGILHTRRVVRLQDTPFAEQERALYELLACPSVRRCCIDRNGIGRQFTERAQSMFGTYRVEGVNFTSTSKEEMAYPVRAAFEDRAIRVRSDPSIIAGLRAVKKEMAGGNVRFGADRGKNGHADDFWALALAMLAGKGGGGSFEYQPVMDRPRSMGGDSRRGTGLARRNLVARL